MHIYSIAVAALIVCGASSLSQQPHQTQRANSSRQAVKNGFWAPVTAAVVGWTLASQVALAQPIVMDPPSAKNPMASLFEQKPEPVYEKLDFSLPSYDSASKASGFGQGTEARNLGQTSTSDESEKDKQREAMLKAEAARQARIEQAKELARMREAEDQARAQAKKEEAARRLRGIFD
jgi:hypothetical protein